MLFYITFGVNGMEKIIIVEGITDKENLLPIINEPIQIVCTNGTVSYDKLEQWSEDFFDLDVYILVDEDRSGVQLRKQLIREFPFATNIHIHREYKEVACAPKKHLAKLLVRANIDVYPQYLTS